MPESPAFLDEIEKALEQIERADERGDYVPFTLLTLVGQVRLLVARVRRLSSELEEARK
jgi:hypothetical protein